MTSQELLHALIATADPEMASLFVNPDGTVKTADCMKNGDGNRELHRVAVAMFPTHDVIRDAVTMGVDLLLVHEPLYYNHYDSELPNEIAREKAEYVRASGLPIFRFHDHAHARALDLIYDGEMRLLGLNGHVEGRSYAHTTFVLDAPMTAMELARVIEKTLGIRHIRIAGCTDRPGTRISCSFGAAGSVAEELETHDFYIGGEIVEWRDGEAVRDYAQFGHNKAAIILPHEESERAGMQLLTEELSVRYPDIVFTYLESGALYTYTD